MIIPSFVVFFTPDVGRRDSGGSFGSINGRSISQREYAAAYYETLINYRFNHPTWPDGRTAESTGFDVDRETRSRIAILELLKREKIYVGDEATAKMIARYFTQGKEFRQDAYQQFLLEAREKNIGEKTVESFAAHQAGIQQLLNVYGSNGKLVTPREAESLYRREREEFETEAIIFSASNYLASVKADPQAISQFYSNQVASYRIPERVQVKYVRFDLASHQAEADKEIAGRTNLAQSIDAYYTQQGAAHFTDANGKQLSEAEAKAKIKDDLKKSVLFQFARREASAFADALFKETNSAALEKLAGDKYKVQTSEPFTDRELPKNLKVYGNFVRRAFALSDEEPFAEPLEGEDGIYIMAYYRKLPSEIPSLEAIRSKVVDDYGKFQAGQAARAAGAAFEQQVTNAVAAGKTAASVFAESKIKPVTIPNFCLATEQLDSPLNVNMLKRLVSTLSVGQATRFFDTSEGGFILRLRAKVPVSAEKIKAELPDFMRSFAQSRQFDAFDEWLGKEVVSLNLQAPQKPSETSKN